MIISSNRQVAIKTCRSTLPVSEKHKFLQGAEMLKQLNNPNIVQLIGIVAENKQLYVIMEFMPGGSFLDFLKTRGRLLTNNYLTVMCSQVCAGMNYLEEKNWIHCDLAARSCLVDKNNNVRIEGFGTIIEEGGTYIPPGGTRVSIKWTAPEVSIMMPRTYYTGYFLSFGATSRAHCFGLYFISVKLLKAYPIDFCVCV